MEQNQVCEELPYVEVIKHCHINAKSNNKVDYSQNDELINCWPWRVNQWYVQYIIAYGNQSD